MTARFIDPLFCQLLGSVPPRRPFTATSNRYSDPDTPATLAVRVYDADNMLAFVSLCNPLDLEQDVEQAALDLCNVYYGVA